MLNIRKKFQMLAENSLNNHFLPFANICTVASFLASYESYTKKKKKERKEAPWMNVNEKIVMVFDNKNAV